MLASVAPESASVRDQVAMQSSYGRQQILPFLLHQARAGVREDRVLSGTRQEGAILERCIADQGAQIRAVVSPQDRLRQACAQAKAISPLAQDVQRTRAWAGGDKHLMAVADEAWDMGIGLAHQKSGQSAGTPAGEILSVKGRQPDLFRREVQHKLGVGRWGGYPCKYP
jgi:hypothetical protein